MSIALDVGNYANIGMGESVLVHLGEKSYYTGVITSNPLTIDDELMVEVKWENTRKKEYVKVSCIQEQPKRRKRNLLIPVSFASDTESETNETKKSKIAKKASSTSTIINLSSDSSTTSNSSLDLKETNRPSPKKSAIIKKSSTSKKSPTHTRSTQKGTVTPKKNRKLQIFASRKLRLANQLIHQLHHQQEEIQRVKSFL